MAHKRGIGSSKNGRDSIGRRLGIKVSNGQKVNSGSIIVRQRGSRYIPSLNTYFGKDYTIHSYISGKVLFKKIKKNKCLVEVI